MSAVWSAKKETAGSTARQ